MEGKGPSRDRERDIKIYTYKYGYSLIWDPIVYRGFGSFVDTPSFIGFELFFVGVSAAF